MFDGGSTAVKATSCTSWSSLFEFNLPGLRTGIDDQFLSSRPAFPISSRCPISTCASPHWPCARPALRTTHRQSPCVFSSRRAMVAWSLSLIILLFDKLAVPGWSGNEVQYAERPRFFVHDWWLVHRPNSAARSNSSPSTFTLSIPTCLT